MHSNLMAVSHPESVPFVQLFSLALYSKRAFAVCFGVSAGQSVAYEKAQASEVEAWAFRVRGLLAVGLVGFYQPPGLG